jgi:ABC-type glycerol-3-phosphate transport system permease component
MYHRGVVMAVVTICLIPLFVLYVVMQRKFVEGVERSELTEE